MEWKEGGDGKGEKYIRDKRRRKELDETKEMWNGRKVGMEKERRT